MLAQLLAHLLKFAQGIWVVPEAGAVRPEPRAEPEAVPLAPPSLPVFRPLVAFRFRPSLFLVLQVALQHPGYDSQLIEIRLVLVQFLEQILGNDAGVLKVVADGVVLPDGDPPAALEAAGHAGALRQTRGFAQQSAYLAQVHVIVVSAHSRSTPVPSGAR